MTKIGVWAPRAGRVELVSGKRTLNLAGDTLRLPPRAAAILEE